MVVSFVKVIFPFKRVVIFNRSLNGSDVRTLLFFLIEDEIDKFNFSVGIFKDKVGFSAEFLLFPKGRFFALYA